MEHRGRRLVGEHMVHGIPLAGKLPLMPTCTVLPRAWDAVVTFLDSSPSKSGSFISRILNYTK